MPNGLVAGEVLDLGRPPSSSQPELQQPPQPSFLHFLFFFSFFLSFHGKLKTRCPPPHISFLKQGLDTKNRPGSRGGCPLVNLSSPRRAVQPRRPSADLRPAGNDRQASASRLDDVRAGLEVGGGGSGTHLRLSRERRSNKAPFSTVGGGDGEPWEEKTQPYLLLTEDELNTL